MSGQYQELTPLRSQNQFNRSEEKNLYGFVDNNPNSKYDLLGLCGGCGPDITQTLTRTLMSVQREWDLASEADRKTTCEKINTPNGWDTTLVSSKSLPSACDSSGECARTVTVNGTCYFAPEVNYVLYGKISALCGVEQGTMTGIIIYWKKIGKPGPDDKQLRGALAWANAGYVGWPNSKPPYSDKPNCKPCSTAHPDVIFNWHAGRLGQKNAK